MSSLLSASSSFSLGTSLKGFIRSKTRTSGMASEHMSYMRELLHRAPAARCCRLLRGALLLRACGALRCRGEARRPGARCGACALASAPSGL